MTESEIAAWNGMRATGDEDHARDLLVSSILRWISTMLRRISTRQGDDLVQEADLPMSVEDVRKWFRRLSDEDRISIMMENCRWCGTLAEPGDISRCQCTNDE